MTSMPCGSRSCRTCAPRARIPSAPTRCRPISRGGAESLCGRRGLQRAGQGRRPPRRHPRHGQEASSSRFSTRRASSNFTSRRTWWATTLRGVQEARPGRHHRRRGRPLQIQERRDHRARGQVCPRVQALRPLPEKWHGLSTWSRSTASATSTSSSTRSRASASCSAAASSRAFARRSPLASFSRLRRHARGLAGGAAARPSPRTTTRWARIFFLRIATRAASQRLLVGGYDRVFEIGRVFPQTRGPRSTTRVHDARGLPGLLGFPRP